MDSRPRKAEAAPMPLAKAFRRAYEGRLTQTQLAEMIGTTQGNVSKWVNGDGPPLEMIPAIERACDRQLGFVLRAAGYVKDAKTTAETIDADPALDDYVREVVLDAYRSAVEGSSARARAREDTVEPTTSRRAKR